MDRVTRIAALSVESADLERLRRLVEEVRGRSPSTLRWATPDEADVLFIDVDSVYGHMDWLRARSSGRRIVSICTRAGSSHENAWQRPLTAAGLLAALASLPPDSASDFDDPVEAAPAATAASSPPRAVPPPAAPPPRFVPATIVNTEPASTAAPAPPLAPVFELFGMDEVPQPADAAPQQPVRRQPEPVEAPAEPLPPVPAATVAAELSLAEFCTIEALPRTSRLVRGDAPALTIDCEQGVYYGPPGLKALEPYCHEPIPRSAWEPVAPAVLAGLRAGGGGQPLSRLLWVNALFGGNGQLLGDHDPAGRFKLARWPQMEREFPRHFRIATVMMKGFATIEEIAAQSGAAATEVVDFINASLVGGQAEAEGSATLLVAGEPAAGRLLARLGLRGRKA